VLTLTTAAAHGYSANTEIRLTGVDEDLDGVWTVTTAPTTTTLTITTTETTAVSLSDLTGVAETTANKTYTFTMGLSGEDTRRLAQRTYWSIVTVDPVTEELYEIKGGNFLTERVGTAVV
jgi:hypothetical protein